MLELRRQWPVPDSGAFSTSLPAIPDRKSTRGAFLATTQGRRTGLPSRLDYLDAKTLQVEVGNKLIVALGIGIVSQRVRRRTRRRLVVASIELAQHVVLFSYVIIHR